MFMPSPFPIPPADENGVITVQREMGTTHREFIRSLTAAIRPATYTSIEGSNGVDIEIHGAPGNMRIHLAPERVRRIALLRLPIVDVTLVLEGFPPESIEPFFTQFDRAFQRGGG